MESFQLTVALMVAAIKKALSSPSTKSSNLIHRNQEGQGLVEYALILVLVAVVVIVILAVLGPVVNVAYFQVMCPLRGGVAFEHEDHWDCADNAASPSEYYGFYYPETNTLEWGTEELP